MKRILFFLAVAISYSIIVYAGAFLGFVSPTLWVFQPAVVAFLAATPVLMLCKARKRFGALFILPCILSVSALIMGELSDAPSILAIAFLVVIAEGVRYAFGYESQIGARVGYAVMGLVPICLTLLPLWLNTDLYYTTAIEEMGSIEYAEGLVAFANPLGLVALVVLTLAAGYLGTLASEKLFQDRVAVQ